MSFLSAKRRHPAFKPLMLLVALLFVGGLYAGFAPAGKSSAEEALAPGDPVKGRELFLVGCASCHGMNGEGGSLDPESGNPEQFAGPSLVGVGGAAVDFQVGTGRMPMANPGAQAPRKDVYYNEQQIRDMAAYVDSLGPGPQVPAEEQYTGVDPNTDPEAVARGGELFRTNCSACHNLTGQGGALPEGKYAPPLVGVDDKHIWEALRTGPQQMPVFTEKNLTDQDVKEIIGYINATENQPEYGGIGLGGLGPVVEGFFAWVVGIGGVLLLVTWIASKGARVK